MIKNIEDRNQLVSDHVHLVKYVVARMSVNLAPGVSREDLISIGSWGLIDAADKFDASKAVQFKTYAITRIRGSILDELRRQSLGGQTLCRKARMLEKAIQAVETRKSGAPAEDAEVAEELGISVNKLQDLYAEVSRSFLVSLDEQNYQDDANKESLGDSLPDKKSPDPETLVERSELKRMIMSCIGEAPEQEKKVLVLYYYEELTFKEIGHILSVSESRISQIHTKAIFRMRGRLKQRLSD